MIKIHPKFTCTSKLTILTYERLKFQFKISILVKFKLKVSFTNTIFILIRINTGFRLNFPNMKISLIRTENNDFSYNLRIIIK